MSKNKKLLIFPCLIIIVCGYIIGFNMVRRADGVGEIVKAPAVAAANIENSGNNDSSGNDKSADASAAESEQGGDTEIDSGENNNAGSDADGTAVEPQGGKKAENDENAELAALGHKININTADKKELMLISGIGEKYAERIIELREQLGGFTSIEQLKKVKGIGDKRFGKIKNYVTIE